jgi:hypothetical protein
MEEMGRELPRGRCIWQGTPAPGGLEDPFYMGAAEGSWGAGLKAIKKADGLVMRDPE